MATNVVKRAEGMPDGQVAETWRLSSLAGAGWVVNAATVSSNATAVSYVAFKSLVNGTFVVNAAGTAAIVGSLATGATGAFLWYLTAGGTISSTVALGVTIGGIAFPVLPASQVALAITIIACTAATAFNGGFNSLADTSYAATHTSFTGPSCLAMSTEYFTVVPG
jgi:hypothetical protein